MVAVMERIVWKVGLKRSQIIGMLFIIVCTVLVSLSELFQASKSTSENLAADDQIPLYVAVIVALLMPLVCTIFANFIKYADKVLRLDALDWNCAFYFFMSLAF